MLKRRIEFDAQADKLVRSAYSQGYNRKHGGVMDVAARLGVSCSTIHRRAAELGIINSGHKKLIPWSPEEEQLLEQHAHRELDSINRILAKHGFQRRNLDSIKSKLKRLNISLRQARTDAGYYTLCELADLFGVDKNKLVRHIKRGDLKAKTRENITQLEYLIAAKDVREFIKTCLPSIDINRIDKYWLVDILTGEI